MNCKQKIIQEIHKKPHIFNELVKKVDCANETVDKYLDEFVLNGKILEKRSKFRILFSKKISKKNIILFELMLNPTIKSIIILLMKTKEISQPEIVEITNKSNATISKAFKILHHADFVSKKYNAPFIYYEIRNKDEIFSILKKIYPNLTTRML